MAEVTSVTELVKFRDLPSVGSPFGMTLLFQVGPTGDRGLTFGRSNPEGLELGKIPGYWTCPYDGTITAVMLNTDIGGYTVRFWKARGHSPIVDDVITTEGYSIASPPTHAEIFDLSNFASTDVLLGDTFAVEIVAVSDPPPTDIAGNVVIIKVEPEQL